jgi:hypothetical protein
VTRTSSHRAQLLPWSSYHCSEKSSANDITVKHGNYIDHVVQFRQSSCCAFPLFTSATALESRAKGFCFDNQSSWYFWQIFMCLSNGKTTRRHMLKLQCTCLKIFPKCKLTPSRGRSIQNQKINHKFYINSLIK